MEGPLGHTRYSPIRMMSDYEEDSEVELEDSDDDDEELIVYDYDWSKVSIRKDCVNGKHLIVASKIGSLYWGPKVNSTRVVGTRSGGEKRRGGRGVILDYGEGERRCIGNENDGDADEVVEVPADAFLLKLGDSRTSSTQSCKKRVEQCGQAVPSPSGKSISNPSGAVKENVEKQKGEGIIVSYSEADAGFKKRKAADSNQQVIVTTSSTEASITPESASLNGGVKRSKLDWTDEEVRALEEGVKYCKKLVNKKPSWRKILDDGKGIFHKTRTPDNLKEKWKSIEDEKISGGGEDSIRVSEENAGEEVPADAIGPVLESGKMQEESGHKSWFEFASGQRRFLWTREELEMLQEGVKYYKPRVNINIPWRKILEDGVGIFHENRTRENLKDMWQRLKRERLFTKGKLDYWRLQERKELEH